MGVLRRPPRPSTASGPARLRFPAAVCAAAVALGAALAATAPWSSPLAPRGVAADSSLDSALLSLLNGDRAGHGLPTFQSSAPLGSVAENWTYGGCGFSVAGRAEDMVRRNYFSHTILNCGSQNAFSIMRAAGIPFNAAAENIGYCSGCSGANAAAQWINSHFMASPEHEGNILNSSYTTVGIGSWWTSAGQTWSGAGSAQSNVVVVAVEFTDAPRTAAPAPAPVHHVTSSPARVAPAVAAPAPVSARRPGVPLTGVVAELPGGTGVDDLEPPRIADDAVLAAARVSARDVSNTATAAKALGVAGMLLLLASLRRRLGRRRRSLPT